MNALPGHTAIYRREDKPKEGAECAFLGQTTSGRFNAPRDRVRALHSRALPCIVAFVAEAGGIGFLDWVRGGAYAASAGTAMDLSPGSFSLGDNSGRSRPIALDGEQAARPSRNRRRLGYAFKAVLGKTRR